MIIINSFSDVVKQLLRLWGRLHSMQDQIDSGSGGGGGVSKLYVDTQNNALQNNINNVQDNVNSITVDTITESSTKVFLSPAELSFLQELKANYES